MNLLGEQRNIELDEKRFIVPPPIVETLEPVETTNDIIPGEIVVDEGGRLLKKFFEYSGFVGDSIEAYDVWINLILEEQLKARPIAFPDGTFAVPKKVTLERPHITIDEKREMVGKDPRPNGEGDVILVPANLLPLGLEISTENNNDDDSEEEEEKSITLTKEELKIINYEYE